MTKNKKLIIIFMLILILLQLFIFSNSQNVLSEDYGLDVQIKTSRVMVKIDEKNETVDPGLIVGTIENNSPNDYNDTRLYVRILSNGTMPVEVKGSGENIEVYPTMAIYKISKLKSGYLADWSVGIGVSDINIKEVVYRLEVRIPDNESGSYKLIYSSVNYTLPVEVKQKIHDVMIYIENFKGYYIKTTVDEKWIAKIIIVVKNNGDFTENISVNIEFWRARYGETYRRNTDERDKMDYFNGIKEKIILSPKEEKKYTFDIRADVDGSLIFTVYQTELHLFAGVNIDNDTNQQNNGLDNWIKVTREGMIFTAGTFLAYLIFIIVFTFVLLILHDIAFNQFSKEGKLFLLIVLSFFFGNIIYLIYYMVVYEPFR